MSLYLMLYVEVPYVPSRCIYIVVLRYLKTCSSMTKYLKTRHLASRCTYINVRCCMARYLNIVMYDTLQLGVLYKAHIYRMFHADRPMCLPLQSNLPYILSYVPYVICNCTLRMSHVYLHCYIVGFLKQGVS